VPGNSDRFNDIRKSKVSIGRIQWRISYSADLENGICADAVVEYFAFKSPIKTPKYAEIALR